MSSFLHPWRREELENESDSKIAHLLSCVSAHFYRGNSFLIPDRHPKIQLAAESVTTILQSERPDGDVASELAELLGFEEVDLVVKLMDKRSEIIEHLAVGFFSSSRFPCVF
jgi:hypothetical protein